MKKISILLTLALCVSVFFCSCGTQKDKTDSSGTKDTRAAYSAPKNIISTEEYRNQLKSLMSSVENFGTADDAYMKKLSDLTDKLKDSITYNEDDIKTADGTIYYVSTDGNDENDGKSEKTPWASLDKVSSFEFKEGDLVLFKRGDSWRGSLGVKSGIAYSAYGKGYKPRILAANEAHTLGNWVQTDKENVWKLDKKIIQNDLGFILLTDKDGKEICCSKKTKHSKLSKNFDFVYGGATVEDGRPDMYVYLYYDGGNPGDVFPNIELPMKIAVIIPPAGIQNLTLNNLELLYGADAFWTSDAKNILISYCTMGWSGGFADKKGASRYYGGSGVWHGCDNFVYDHCYIYQQYEPGISPQYIGEGNKSESFFKDFIVKDSLFDSCEWTLEYYSSQNDYDNNGFDGLYFGYNICINGGRGLGGEKASTSCYIQSWNHEGPTVNSTIEYNVFDRAASETLNVGTTDNKIPKLSNNLYIQFNNKKFGRVNSISYQYTKSDLEKYIDTGVETNPVFLFAEK